MNYSPFNIIENFSSYDEIYDEISDLKKKIKYIEDIVNECEQLTEQIQIIESIDQDTDVIKLPGIKSKIDNIPTVDNDNILIKGIEIDDITLTSDGSNLNFSINNNVICKLST